MQNKIRKGMILAAGLGTRLLPVTEKMPKPLVPVLNIPNILYSLSVLKRAGIEEVIINLHYLPNQIEDFFRGGERWGMKVCYSRETQLLGTGGGLKKAEAFFQGEPLVVVNCDFISDVDLNPLVERHFARKALGTMVLLENPAAQPFYSKVGIDSEGHLVSLPRLEISRSSRVGIFTGVHILDGSAFKHLKETPSGINELLYPAWMKSQPKSIYGDFIGDASWYDTGERNTLWMSSLKLLGELQSGSPYLRNFLAEFGGYEEKDAGVWGPRGIALPLR